MSWPVRRSDPQTSHEAAPDHDGRATVRSQVLAAAVELIVFSDSELTDKLNQTLPVPMDRSRVARRRKDLCEAGLVEPYHRPSGGPQVKTLGPEGRRQLLWRITQEGIDANQ